MKKYVCVIVAAVLVFSACKNMFFPEPVVPPKDSQPYGRSGTPEGISVSHGKKRSIDLSWGEVFGAVRYNISSANSPLEPFIQCAETAETRFTFTVKPGSTVYYKVGAVLADGTQTALSSAVMGTSLAQPLITDISDTTESSGAVTWYMENVSDATYKNNLRYTVYCFDGEIEVAQRAIDGSQLTENKALFTGLLSAKKYLWQVEAYLVNDQENSEKSELMDKETARRFRPGAPENVTASRGTSINSIALSFDLPDMVNIALNAGEFEIQGLYFVISKRLYSESKTNEYVVVCSYFGSAAEKSPAKGGGATFTDDYEVGKTVTWTDVNTARGVEYEYMVQAYVDGTAKTISSDTSKASSVGWALTQGTLHIGQPEYAPDDEDSRSLSLPYETATLPIEFDFDPKGEEYRYRVAETVDPIEDDDERHYDPDAPFTRESRYFSYDEIGTYATAINLTSKSSVNSPGRGVYSYKVMIYLPDDETALDTVEAVGFRQVSEDRTPLILTAFDVVGGFLDKFLVRWEYDDTPDVNCENVIMSYNLYESSDGKNYTLINTWKIGENLDPPSGIYIEEELTGYQPDTTVYFAMQPVKQQENESGPFTRKGTKTYLEKSSRTLGIPKSLSVNDKSYSTITVQWEEAQEADTYRINSSYEEGVWNEEAKVARSELTLNVGTGTLQYSFKPAGYNDVQRSGKSMQIQIDALNEGLKTRYSNRYGNDEIASSSSPINARLVGPAELDLQASKAVFDNCIEVSWNKIIGADGYYVFRRQFTLDNQAETSGGGAIAYYVPAQESNLIVVTGKGLTVWEGVRTDTTNIKATAAFNGSRYTLTDDSMSNHEYGGGYANHAQSYRDQQNELAWGYPYRYYIVPVVTKNGQIESLDSIEFQYAKGAANTDAAITKLSVGTDVNYANAAAIEQTGFTFGFGQGVTASKGTYASTANSGNDGVRITWSAPPLLASVPGFTPRYTIYRRANGSNSWETINSVDGAQQFVDIPSTLGITHEYLIGIRNGNSPVNMKPQDFPRFIAHCGTLRDEKDRPHYLGFRLDKVKMEKVSRDARKVGDFFAEEVKWKSAGIKNPYSEDNNWGIDGYTIFLLNRNINNLRQWINVGDFLVSGLDDQVNQTAMIANDDSNRLKVLRDYRHYYKVRSFVLNDGDQKVYSPDPSPPIIWTTGGATSSYVWTDSVEDDYVKWGARQVTPEEYTAITSLHMAIALQWYSSTVPPPDKNWNNRPHNVQHSRKNTGYDVDLKFNNSQPYFLTISGTLYAFAGASWEIPCEYAAYCDGSWGVLNNGKNMRSQFTITGPADLDGMYTGTVDITERITHGDVGPSGRYGGKYNVSYNGLSGAPEWKHFGNSFRYYSGVSNSTSQDYKQTRNLDWSLSTGITATNSISGQSDKWWYPLNGTQAGWD